MIHDDQDFGYRPAPALGEPLTIMAAATAAVALAESMGIDVDKLLKDGVDAVLDWLGINSCSKKNKNKYRRKVNAATPAEMAGWVERRRVAGATGNCNKYALTLTIRRLKAMGELAAREAAGGKSGGNKSKGPPAAMVDRRRQILRIMAGTSTRSACQRAVDAERARDGSDAAVWAPEFERVVTGTCRRKPARGDGSKSGGSVRPRPRVRPSRPSTPAAAAGMGAFGKIAIAGAVLYGAREMGWV